jgi:uncharacterized membrane protein YoaK (UPF0700 family)
MRAGASGSSAGDDSAGSHPQESVWRTAAHGPLPALLLVLTVITGAVDAVSLLSLGRVFVANMTGNVVFIGLALVGAPGFSLGASLVALLGFLAGATFGGWLNTRFHNDRAVLLLAACTVEVALSAAALAIAGGGADLAAKPGRYSLSILLAAVMGIQNAVVRRLGVPDLTTTVLTMTLTGIAADIRTGGWRSLVLRRRILAVAAMLGGAAAGGALVLRVSPTADLVLVTCTLLAVTAGAWATATRDKGDWRRARPG